MNVLVIDDSKTMRDIIKSVLTQIGCERVEEASDGKDALRTLADFAPELVLVDLNMPNMDGLEFVKAYRQISLTTPMIMVTTDSGQAQVVEAIKAGVDDYIVKPFTPALLAHRVREAMKKSKAA
jgi:two-component system chemotaxis response regulator CheY